MLLTPKDRWQEQPPDSIHFRALSLTFPEILHTISNMVLEGSISKHLQRELSRPWAASSSTCSAPLALFIICRCTHVSRSNQVTEFLSELILPF